jgi:hypothetical protein
MTSTRRILTGTVGVIVAGLFVSAASGQTIRPAQPGVYRMEIFSGPNRTVRYFGTGVSPGEDTSLRELERTENELTYARELLAVKKAYAESERLLEPHRREVQQQLYGISTTQTSFGGFGFPGGLYGGLGAFGRNYGFANAGYPYLAAAPGYAYAGYGSYLYPAAGGLFGTLGGTSTVTRSLANGVGSEGAVKDAMAITMARQATPEFAASIEAGHERALVRLSDDKAMRTVLGLPKPPRGGDIRAVNFERGPVIVTLKTGEKVVGNKMEEKGEWIIVTGNGQTTRLRAGEVVRIDEKTKKGVGPAADE